MNIDLYTGKLTELTVLLGEVRSAILKGAELGSVRGIRVLASRLTNVADITTKTHPPGSLGARAEVDRRRLCPDDSVTVQHRLWRGIAICR